MPPRTNARKAENRRAKHEEAINNAKSARDCLRYALEWVASEARNLDETGITELIDHIRGVAKTLNERSRT